jgi:DNA-binding MarR family transcriptional regulator
VKEQHIDVERPGTERAIRNLRMLILAGERYRQVLADAIGLGTTESQALSYLEVHGSSGQSEMARDLGLTSSALTALVDRLERQGVAERVRHAQDRRRAVVRVTERGAALVLQSHDWLDATLHRIDPANLELVSDSLAIIANDLFDRKSGQDAPDTAAGPSEHLSAGSPADSGGDPEVGRTPTRPESS